MTTVEGGASELTETRSRVLSLIDFLAALHARRHPPVHDISKDSLDLIRDASLPASPGVTLSPTSQAWLTVEFVEIPPRPDIPDDLAPYFASPGRWTHQTPPAMVALDEPTAEEEVLLASAQRWVDQVWQKWSAAVKELSPTKELYRRLFEIRERVENDRDGVELVWGFGRLLWQHPDIGTIDHPLLTFGVEIDIDSTTNCISVRPSGALSVESLYLSDVTITDRPGFNAVKASYLETETALDPWEFQFRNDLIRRLVRCFDHDGTFAEAGATHPPTEAAQADDSWVLCLRRRQPDYQGFLDGMRDLYRDGVVVPAPLASLVLAEPSKLLGEGGVWETPGSLEPLLLPLAANDEQRRILEHAQTRPGVTVQGPPGTGKSHTIANLISHYVAYGKRVLVVAEKEQALRVLADKIPAGIRDLTVSVLGGDDEGRRQLETSVQKIQTRVSGIDRSWEDSEIVRLGGELDAINRTITETNQRLMNATQRESDRLHGRWGGIDDPHVGAAAEWVHNNEATFGYIPDELALTTPSPISPGELAEILELLGRIGIDTAEKCAVVLPPLEELPVAARLAELFAALDGFAQLAQEVAADLQSMAKVDATSASDLVALRTQANQEQRWLIDIAGTWIERVIYQFADWTLAAEWPEFLSQIRAEREQILTLGRELEAHTVAVPEAHGPQFEATLREALDRLTQKGKLGLFSGDTKKSLGSCTVDGRTPTTAAEVQLCLAELRRHQLRQQLTTRWANRMGRVNGPLLDSARPEDELGALMDQLHKAIDAPTRWMKLREHLDGVGIAAPHSVSSDELTRLDSALAVALQRKDERLAQAEIDGLAEMLGQGASGADASPLWRLLLDALHHRHTESWGQLRAEVIRLHELAPQALRLLQLLQRLRTAAPVWTARIVADPAAAGDPSQLPTAWQWRQMDCWVTRIISQDDPATLQRQLEAAADRRRSIIAELVERRAWRRLADNLGDRERAALNKYIAAVNRYGKTGGKYAARFLQMMREALNDSKSAVPVWVMTTQRALTGFRPDATPPFDVLIIDEASQIGVEAIPLLSLAKSTIVVGDDQQTSPESIGQNLESYFELLESHLSKIPDYKALFVDGNSLYNVAFLKFPGVIMLTEHFRCLPEIIEFSNRHIYGNRIVPLRDRPPAPGWKPVGAIRVLDGYRDGKAKLNHPEADAVVDLIDKCCHDPLYDGMDFGVVSLLGTEQSKLIWDKLFDRLGPELMRKRRIRCGEPANFQGDERDVMVLSVVAATDPNNPAGRIAAATSRSDVRRINVAASRARHQMWVVYSLDASRFNDDDLRGALIRHCENPSQIADLQDALRYESPFEEAVVARILNRGYRRIKTQYDVGRYRIDIVVEGPERRLAVECDGERWHGPERWEADRARQEVLERAGWTFERIRGSAFYRDPDAALEPLWARLEQLGIPTGDDWLHAPPRSSVYEVGHDRVELVAAPARQKVPENFRSLSEATPPLDTPSVNANVPEAPDSAAFSLSTSAAPTAPRPTIRLEPSRHDSQPISPGLESYAAWTPHAVVDPLSAKASHIVDVFTEILAVEGPMYASRAYQLYNRAAGGQRVGRELRRAFNTAMAQGIRDGKISQLRDDVEGQSGKTVYLPDTPAVRVRELGPRALNDVPLSELKELIRLLGLMESPRCHREVLDAYGLTRLTQNAQEYIDAALRYDWK